MKISNNELFRRIASDYSNLRRAKCRPEDIIEWYRNAIFKAESGAGREAAGIIVQRLEGATSDVAIMGLVEGVDRMAH